MTYGSKPTILEEKVEGKPPERRTGMSYETAPTTKILATHCAACGKPLVDAASVEAGMGPDCRARLLNKVEVSEADRKEANQLVYKIAIVQNGMDAVEPLARLRDLGFHNLADRIEKRCVAVKIVDHAGTYIVKTPYNEDSLHAWRRIPGRHWDGENEVNVVPHAQRQALWGLLKQFYSGAIATGPKGPFVIQ